MHAHTPVQAVNIWAVFTVTSYRASLFSLSNSHKKPQRCVTRPQIWNVCRTNSDVVTWFIDYLFSLLTVNIFLPALSLGSSGPETLGFATALWDPMQNHTVMTSQSMMRKQKMLHSETHRHLEVLASRPCGEGYEKPHGRRVRCAGCCVQRSMQ